MTPGQRNYYPLNRKELLLFSRIKAKSKKNYSYKGRNGKITTWHLGGGHKQLYRQLDNTFGVVEGLEYDPNRTSWISRANLSSTYLGVLGALWVFFLLPLSSKGRWTQNRRNRSHHGKTSQKSYHA